MPRQQAFLRRVFHILKSAFPNDIEPVVGQRLQLRKPDGNLIDVDIIDIEDELVTIDANHPLAGHKLLFYIEMVGIM